MEFVDKEVDITELGNQPVKINLGCGKRNFGEDWIHIDGENYPHIVSKDINLHKFENNSVDIIYASHLIAYWDKDGVKDLFRSWHRVLKQDGILRIATPNFDMISALYYEKKIDLSQCLGLLYGKMVLDGDFIYHKSTWDLESLEEILVEIGFMDVKLYDWRKTEHAQFDDHSQAYIPHMDKNNGVLVSLNIECIK